MPYILSYGIIFILVGLSARANQDFIYMAMYDSYYLGMKDVLLKCFHNIEMVDLLKKDINDEYQAIRARSGSLNDVMSGCCSIVGNSIGIIALLFVAFNISKIVFVISLLYAFAIVKLNTSFAEKIRWNTLEYRKIERLAGYYQTIAKTPGAAKEIRIFSIKNHFLSKWRQAYQGILKFEFSRIFSQELRTFLSGLSFYIFLIAMLVYSIFEVQKGATTVDEFVIIYTLCLSMYSSLTLLAKNYIATDYGMFSLERQYNFIVNVPYIDENIEKTKTAKVKESENVFETNNLSFQYGNGTEALKNISISIKKGEVIALVGKNGSGKSTLIKLLLNLFKPTSGEIFFCGYPYSSYKKAAINKQIGTFFQDYYLFHLPLRENVAIGNIENVMNNEKLRMALEKGGATKILQKLPKGLDTYLGRDVFKDGAELSGGEKQRIAVARAHMSERDILIFDEPAAMLDPIAELEQFKRIREKIESKTAILISHRIGFARLADKIIVLDKGKVVEQGTHDQLVKNQGLYAHLYNEQAQWYDTKGVE